jgi:hypothetical protein
MPRRDRRHQNPRTRANAPPFVPSPATDPPSRKLRERAYTVRRRASSLARWYQEVRVGRPAWPDSRYDEGTSTRTIDPEGALRLTAGVRVTGEVSAAEQARLQHRPDDVRVLFIGESAPAGGTFFYFKNSKLYQTTCTAFERGAKDLFGRNFLCSFQALAATSTISAHAR